VLASVLVPAFCGRRTRGVVVSWLGFWSGQGGTRPSDPRNHPRLACVSGGFFLNGGVRAVELVGLIRDGGVCRGFGAWVVVLVIRPTRVRSPVLHDHARLGAPTSKELAEVLDFDHIRRAPLHGRPARPPTWSSHPPGGSASAVFCSAGAPTSEFLNCLRAYWPRLPKVDSSGPLRPTRLGNRRFGHIADIGLRGPKWGVARGVIPPACCFLAGSRSRGTFE